MGSKEKGTVTYRKRGKQEKYCKRRENFQGKADREPRRQERATTETDNKKKEKREGGFHGREKRGTEESGGREKRRSPFLGKRRRTGIHLEKKDDEPRLGGGGKKGVPKGGNPCKGTLTCAKTRFSQRRGR